MPADPRASRGPRALRRAAALARGVALAATALVVVSLLPAAYSGGPASPASQVGPATAVGFTALTLNAYDESAYANGDPFPYVLQYPAAPAGGATACATISATRLDFDWGRASVGGTCPAEYFSVYGTGMLVGPYTGTVEFCTSNDDGMYVHIGGSFTIGDWGLHGPDDPCNNTASMDMVAGDSYPVTAWFYDNEEGAVMRLKWRWNGGAWATVPGLASTVAVTPTGTPGTVTSSDDSIDCTWDGTNLTGTCSTTTTADIILTATPATSGHEWTWSGTCAGQVGPTCTPSLSYVTSSVGVAFDHPCGAAGNLLANCGFEAGDLSSWTTGGTVSAHDRDGNPVRTGLWSAGLASWDGLGTLSQTVAVTAGDHYRLRFHLKEEWNLPTGARFEAAVTNGGTTRTAVTVSTKQSDWTAYTHEFTAAGSSVTITFRGYETWDWWYLDDTSLVSLGTDPRTYTVAVETPVRGAIASSDSFLLCPAATCTHPYAPGTSVTFTATPDADNDLGAWTGDCAGTVGTSCTVTVYSGLTVGATFGRLLTITAPTNGSITSGDGLIDCGSGATACSALYAPGTTVTLTATPDTDFTFGSWSGCTSTTATCSVTLSGAVTVGATFDSWFGATATGPNRRGLYALTATWSIPAGETVRVTLVEVWIGDVLVASKSTSSTSGSFSKTVAGPDGVVRFYVTTATKRGATTGGHWATVEF